MVVETCELVHSVEVSNTLGEGVLWNERTQTVWWTDIQRARIYEYDLTASELRSRDTPYRVGCFGFVEDSPDLVVAFDRGIAIYSLRTGGIEWLVEPGALAAGVRFNDGKVDSRGRFWVGTMIEDPAVPAGSCSLYCYDRRAGLIEVLGNITISNGLCWSPDGSVLYHADSPSRSIRGYRFDVENGTASGPRVFAVTPPGVEPDGSAVDTDGGVWSAQWGGSRVVRYTAEGEMDVVVDMPVSQPSCVAFGGADLDLLFVTSAREGLGARDLAAEPRAGDLFVYRTNFRGLPAFRFRQAPDAASPR